MKTRCCRDERSLQKGSWPQLHSNSTWEWQQHREADCLPTTDNAGNMRPELAWIAAQIGPDKIDTHWYIKWINVVLKAFKWPVCYDSSLSVCTSTAAADDSKLPITCSVNMMRSQIQIQIQQTTSEAISEPYRAANQKHRGMTLDKQNSKIIHLFGACATLIMHNLASIKKLQKF